MCKADECAVVKSTLPSVSLSITLPNSCNTTVFVVVFMAIRMETQMLSDPTSITGHIQLMILSLMEQL